MATTIDELVISLSLDARNFNAQQQQAVTNLRRLEQQATVSGTNVERGAQKMVDGFSRVTKEILGVGAAILGVNGLKDLAVNLTQVAAATERMSEAFELDPEMLNKWQGFLRAVGNQDFSTTSASLGALSKAIQEFRATQKGPLLDAIPWLGKVHVSPADILAGTPSQALNALLLKVGANINNPENVGIRTEILSHIPGMTPTMMRGLERAPTQKTLDSYLTATAEQMHSASRMMEAITELALALTKKLNVLLPDVEKPVVGVARKLAAGDVMGALNEEEAATGPLVAQAQRSVHEAIKDQFTRRGSWLDNFLMIGGGHHDPAKRTYFPDPGPMGVPPIPLDTSTMPQTNRFPDGSRRGGNVTHNNITANISAPKSDDPRIWADIWSDRVKAAMATGGAH